jgi:hypothetical protein
MEYTWEGFDRATSVRDSKENNKSGPTLLFTVQDFKDGRTRRWGTANPTKFDIVFWNAMVKGDYSPYTARRVFIDSVAKQDIAKKDEEQRAKEDAKEADDEKDVPTNASGMRSLANLMGTMEAKEEQKNKTPKAKLEPMAFRHVEYGMSVTSKGRAMEDPEANF